MRPDPSSHTARRRLAINAVKAQTGGRNMGVVAAPATSDWRPRGGSPSMYFVARCAPRRGKKGDEACALGTDHGEGMRRAGGMEIVWSLPTMKRSSPILSRAFRRGRRSPHRLPHGSAAALWPSVPGRRGSSSQRGAGSVGAFPRDRAHGQAGRHGAESDRALPHEDPAGTDTDWVTSSRRVEPLDFARDDDDVKGQTRCRRWRGWRSRRPGSRCRRCRWRRPRSRSAAPCRPASRPTRPAGHCRG
jgi:hypothetical protein